LQNRSHARLEETLPKARAIWRSIFPQYTDDTALNLHVGRGHQDGRHF
jgi:hypothetical protein